MTIGMLAGCDKVRILYDSSSGCLAWRVLYLSRRFNILSDVQVREKLGEKELMYVGKRENAT